MNYTIVSDISNINIEQWVHFTNNHPNSNFFQSPDIYYFFREVKNYEPLVIICLSENYEIVGSLLAVIQRENMPILNFFTARTIIWGGPLISIEHPKTMIAQKLIIELNKKVGKKSIYTEFRNLYDLTEYKETFISQGYDFFPHLNFIVKTSNKEQAIKNLSNSKWRQIKKAQANGAVISCASTLDEVKEYYEILKKLYKEKVKKPLPDWSFFKKFHENKDLGNYLLIKNKNNVVIGGMLCPVFKTKAVYEWYVCGLDEDYKELYPSIVATWAAIEYAATHQIDTMDFLGAGSPDKDYGVREFKSKFGGELVSYGRFRKNNYQLLYSIGKAGLKLKKKFSIF